MGLARAHYRKRGKARVSVAASHASYVAIAIVRGVEPGLRKRSCGARQLDPRDWAIPNPGRSCVDASILAMQAREGAIKSIASGWR